MAGISFGGRSFEEVRDQLFTHITHYYPDLVTDFSDGATGTMLVELLAAAVEGLEFRLDRNFQETQRLQAQQRSSLLALADNMGVRVPGRRAAVTIVDFSVTVPVAGDSYDAAYAPVMTAGAQVTGGGRTFETLGNVDFKSLYSTSGVPNQTLIPNFDAGGRVASYTITKSEIVVNGVTTTLKTIVPASRAKPFYRLVLPDPDVLSVVKVVNLPGLVSGNDVDLLRSPDANVRPFREVDFLAQDKLFVTDKVATAGLGAGQVAGHWENLTYKFLSRYDAYGRLELTFGGGTGNIGPLLAAVGGLDSAQGLALAPFLQSNALGEKVLPGSTLVVQYRTGGGVGSNVGPRVLNTPGRVEMGFIGPDTGIQQSVRRSLKVINIPPALGGADEPGKEELRQLIGYQHAAKYACITLRDYLAVVYQMPGKYGAPAKVTAYLENNVIIIAILGYDAQGALTNQSTSLLKSNLSEYLAGVKAVNDSVEIRDGQLYHLVYDVEVLSDGSAGPTEITTGVAGAIADFHLPAKMIMGGTLVLSPLLEAINNLPGVTNIQSFRVYNPVGGVYSLNRSPHTLLDAGTGELDVRKGLITSGVDGAYAVKNLFSDVRVSISKLLSA